MSWIRAQEKARYRVVRVSKETGKEETIGNDLGIYEALKFASNNIFKGGDGKYSASIRLNEEGNG